jgi:hypothetical protein
MLATNLVYATVGGMYPRLLGDDGIHEPLVLPYDLDADVPFQFHSENDSAPLNTAGVFDARYIRPDGVIVTLGIGSPPFIVSFPSALPAGGLCILTIRSDAGVFQCYPFRVLRPTETHTPSPSNPTDN